MFRLPSFDRAFRRLTPEQQAAVNAVLQQLPGAFGQPHRHAGLGLRPFGRYFECRAGLGLRVLFLVDEGAFFLVTVGSHDQIRSYIKNNR
jgi:mRNA-degrading endonuclease RelE of RelBE toxin-antitoxin system